MLTVMAQRQIQNPGFETWENEENAFIEPAHWNSFKTASGGLNSQGAKQLDKQEDARPGSTGHYSVRINTRTVFGIPAQGNLTTGRINMGAMNATDANGNYNYTQEDDADFNQPFTGLPDAMRLWVKVSCSFGGAASCNLHTTGYFQDPAGNTITATRIAKADNSAIANSEEWQEITIPFVYDVTDGTRPAYALVTLTTSGQPGKGNASDWMIIDDVEFLYYSELQSITFNGKDIAITGNTITIDGTYDADLLQLKSNGQGAAISTFYTESSKTLTVSIKGDDIEENPSNTHTYTLVFTGKENEKPTPDPEPAPDPEPEPTLDTRILAPAPFGSFEQWKNECGTTFQPGNGDRRRPGIEPEGWNGSSITVKLSWKIEPSEVLVERTEGAAGTQSAVKLTNKKIPTGVDTYIVPGFVSYGNNWAWSGLTSVSKSDQGTYGGLNYSKRPDAVQGIFKRSAESNEDAHFIAYLWKGTFKGDVGAYGSPSTERENLDRNVMGKVIPTGGDGQLIASCDYTFQSTKDNDWETITVPLTYVEGQEDAVPEKMNIIISSGDYWSRSVKAGNVLEADEIAFVFYSSLASATYGGKEITFDKDNHAVMDEPYSARKELVLTSNGRSATIENRYDNTARQLIITIKGGNFDENPDNVHIYTVQFPFYSDLTKATYKGADITFDENNHAVIDDNYEEAQLLLTAHDAAAAIEKSYNSTTRILTITVKGANYATDNTNVHTYTVEFLPQEKIVRKRSYTDMIQVKVNEGEGELQNATITLQEWNTGKTTLVMKNFKMGDASNPMYVGSIVVNDLTLESDGTFQASRTITIQPGDDPADKQWLGPALGEVPVEIDGKELTGRSEPDSLHVHIIIDLKDRMGQDIDVLFGKSLIDAQEQGGGDDPTPGPGKITLPDHQDYVDALTVTVNDVQTPPQTTTISIDFHKNNNTLDLILKDFKLQDTGVGTINVKGIGYTLKNGVAYATFNKNVIVAIEAGSDPNEFWMGEVLGEIPIKLAGKAGTEKLYCTIDINMEGVGVIHVDFGTDADWPKVGGGGGGDDDPKEDKILQDRIYRDIVEVTVNGYSSRPEEKEVHMTVNENGTVNFSLKNFHLITSDGEDMPVGNVNIEGIEPIEVKDKGYYMFQSEQNITISDGDDPHEVWVGPYLGQIPAMLSGKIAATKFYCNISIYLAKTMQNIRVTVGENFTDGIHEVQGSRFKVQDSSVYNLAGQRLDNAQLKRGIYIVNGKKILVK